MKRMIRQSCFETNSSSVHAIVVNPKGTLIIPVTHVINFNLGTFGWELANYKTIDDRASYLWTAILENYSNEFRNKEDSYYTKETRNWVDYINKAVDEKFNGDIQTYFEWPGSKDFFFYVDHASELRSWLDFLKSDPENLLQFLLGSDSVIYTGNDNDECFYPKVSCPNGWYLFKK